jgi:hypothetical protein
MNIGSSPATQPSRQDRARLVPFLRPYGISIHRDIAPYRKAKPRITGGKSGKFRRICNCGYDCVRHTLRGDQLQMSKNQQQISCRSAADQRFPWLGNLKFGTLSNTDKVISIGLIIMFYQLQ